MNSDRKVFSNKTIGALCIIAGLVCNKFVIETLFAGDGTISALTVNIGIAVLQASLLVAGVLYIKQQHTVLACVGVGLLLLFVLQFWVRMAVEVPFSEKRMLNALPVPPSFFKAGSQYRDQISRYEARFQELKTNLPPDSVVGYLSSEQIPPVDAKVHYGLTKYALAPIRVLHSIECEWIVGNFPDSSASIPIYASDNVVLFKDFGNGVVLFRRTKVP